MNNFLVVIDMQNDFISGPLGTKEAVALPSRVIEKTWDFDGRVLFTYDTHDENYPNTQEGRRLPVTHCVEGTDGWRLHAELEDLRFKIGGRAFTKTTFGCRGLGEYLDNENARQPIDRVELVGLCTDMCVISNALLLKAFLPEVCVCVDSACCAGTTPENHARALEVMRLCQIDVL